MTQWSIEGAAVVSAASAFISGADKRTNLKSADVRGLPSGQERTKRTHHTAYADQTAPLARPAVDRGRTLTPNRSLWRVDA
jgi:hypothetical protein